MKVEWWMMKVECWRMMISSCWGVLLYDGRTNKWTNEWTFVNVESLSRLKMNLTLWTLCLANSLFQYLDIQKFNCNKWRSIQTCIFSYLSLSSGYCVSGKLWPASRYFIHTFQNSEIRQMDKWKSAILVVAMNNEREFLTIKVLDN